MLTSRITKTLRQQLRRGIFPLVCVCAQFVVSCGGTIELRGRATVTISDGPIFDYAYQNVGTTTTKVFTITNIKDSVASSLTDGPPVLSAPFTFSGGTFPGTGGTCTDTLPAKSSCTVVVAFQPTAVLTYSQTLSIYYSDRISDQIIQRGITGRGKIPATLDVTYNTTGTVTTAVTAQDDNATASIMQSDGKILVAGYSNNGVDTDFSVVRYDTTGSLDTSFNGTGVVTTPILAADDRATSIALQTDGKIIVGGNANNGVDNDFALVRYNSDGSLDTSFNGTGIVTTPIGAADDLIFGVAVQGDGAIVVAGYSYNGVDDDFAVARYDSAGALDPSFNTTGFVTTAVGAALDRATSVVIQGDGAILVGGRSSNGADDDFAVVRYDTVGNLDTSFNLTGIVTTAVAGNNDGINALRLLSDGRIFAVGYSNNGANDDIALARYDSTGTLDSTLNGTGLVVTPVGAGQDIGTAATFQADGSILVSGYTFNGADNDAVLIRYSSAGVLDTSFNTTGILTFTWGAAEDRAIGVSVQSDGMIVVAGYSFIGGNLDFAAARYWY